MNKILFYTDAPYIGGVTNHLLTLVRNLNKNKFQPIVVLHNSKNLEELYSAFKKNSIEYYLLNNSKNNLLTIIQFIKLIKKTKPNIIHFHLPHSGSCRFFYFYKFFYKSPLICTEHDPFKLNIFKKLFKKFTISLTNLTLTVSKTNQEFIKKEYNLPSNRIKFIHNGINIDKISPKHQLSKIQNIGYLGELHKRKGIDILIRAFKSLNNPNLKLYIAGQGKDKATFRKLSTDLNLETQVKFLGYQKNITKFFKLIDLLIIPSRREAFGLIALEGFAHRLPIIASNIDGLAEIIEDQKSGLLFEPENEADLLKKLTMLINNPKRCNNLQIEGIKRLKGNFTASIMTQKYQNIYLQII